jgi:hypothetical protein
VQSWHIGSKLLAELQLQDLADYIEMVLQSIIDVLHWHLLVYVQCVMHDSRYYPLIASTFKEVL